MGPGGGSTGEMRPTSRTRTRCASGGSMGRSRPRSCSRQRGRFSEAMDRRWSGGPAGGVVLVATAVGETVSFKRIDARSGADSLLAVIRGQVPDATLAADGRHVYYLLLSERGLSAVRLATDGSGETVTVAAPRAPAARADGIVLAAAIQPTATIAVSSDERTLVIGDCFMSCTARVVDLASGGERAINGWTRRAQSRGGRRPASGSASSASIRRQGSSRIALASVSRRSSSMSTSDSDSRCRAGGASRCSAFRARTRCRSCSVRSRSRRTAPRPILDGLGIFSGNG